MSEKEALDVLEAMREYFDDLNEDAEEIDDAIDALDDAIEKFKQEGEEE